MPGLGRSTSYLNRDAVPLEQALAMARELIGHDRYPAKRMRFLRRATAYRTPFIVILFVTAPAVICRTDCRNLAGQSAVERAISVRRRRPPRWTVAQYPAAFSEPAPSPACP